MTATHIVLAKRRRAQRAAQPDSRIKDAVTDFTNVGDKLLEAIRDRMDESSTTAKDKAHLAIVGGAIRVICHSLRRGVLDMDKSVNERVAIFAAPDKDERKAIAKIVATSKVLAEHIDDAKLSRQLSHIEDLFKEKEKTKDKDKD